MARRPDPAAEGPQFWNHAVRLYERPEIAAACLALQDAHGCDVNLLLLCLWRAEEGQSFTTAQLDALLTAVAPWNRHIVHPLRAARRELRHPEPLGVTAKTAAACRSAIQAAELEAERVAQSVLLGQPAAVAATGPTAARCPPAEAAHTSLRAYASLLGLDPLPAAFARLAAAFPASA